MAVSKVIKIALLVQGNDQSKVFVCEQNICNRSGPNSLWYYPVDSAYYELDYLFLSMSNTIGEIHTMDLVQCFEKFLCLVRAT